MEVNPIEAASYEVVAQRLDLSVWPEGPAAVVARVVHATAEPELAGALVVDQAAVDAGVAALRAGAPVVCDVEMDRVGPAPVVVVGCAPTALVEVTRRISASWRPSLVVAVPVGYIGAAEAKADLLAVARAAGVPAIVLTGERGGAAVAAAVVNALHGLATGAAVRPATPPALFVIGHGTRSETGAAQLRGFATAVAQARPGAPVGAGYIEFMSPGLDEAIDELVTTATSHVVAIPLVLLGAGHMKDDGPAALRRARVRHPEVHFTYGRDLGVHPLVLDTVADRIRTSGARLDGGTPDAVVLVGRGSSDPDANADLVKAARLLAD